MRTRWRSKWKAWSLAARPSTNTASTFLAAAASSEEAGSSTAIAAAGGGGAGEDAEDGPGDRAAAAGPGASVRGLFVCVFPPHSLESRRGNDYINIIIL